jgi:hypothetical protein
MTHVLKALALIRANAVGFAALFVVLGGSAYAASQGSGPGRNTIGAPQIKANAVASSEIRDGSVTHRDIGDNAVGSAEISDSTITLGDLNFQVPQRGDVGVRGTTQTNSANLAGLGFSAVATQEFDLPEPSAGLTLGQVTLTDVKDGNDSRVELRVVHNGHVEGDAVFADTVADGASTTAPVSYVCNSMTPGPNTFSLEVRQADGASNVVVGARSLQIVQFGPIFHPPG